jgi:hypothetical protein
MKNVFETYIRYIYIYIDGFNETIVIDILNMMLTIFMKIIFHTYDSSVYIVNLLGCAFHKGQGLLDWALRLLMH